MAYDTDAYVNGKLVGLYVHRYRSDSTRAMPNFSSCSEIGPSQPYAAINSMLVLASSAQL
jgi:hypothetical protein